MQPIETIEYKDFTIKIYYDENAECPLDYEDNAVIWVTWERNSIFSSRKYRLFDEREDAAPWAKANGYEIFPLFKYEHGAVAYNVGGFHCPWDSGQVGFLLLKIGEFGDSKEYADIFCKTMSNWCNGWFTGYVLEDEDGEHLDSCWGFDDQDHCIEQAKEMADYFSEERAALPGKYQAVADAALNPN